MLSDNENIKIFPNQKNFGGFFSIWLVFVSQESENEKNQEKQLHKNNPAPREGRGFIIVQKYFSINLNLSLLIEKEFSFQDRLQRSCRNIVQR